MRCLVTGGAGFVGSHLCERLAGLGHDVVAYDDLSTGSRANLDALDGTRGFRFIHADIRDEASLAGAMADADAVWHLAAAVGVRLILDSPARTIETNVEGTASVLRLAAERRVKTLIASTSEVYGKSERVPFREDDDIVLGAVTRSRWSYAASKLLDEFLALAAHAERGVPVVVARLFNTVGPRQSGRWGMVLPRLAEQALRQAPLTVFGDGLQSRCFASVHDVVDGLVALMESERAVGEVVNLGNPEEITILDLARKLVERTGSRSDIVHIPYDEAFREGFEDMRRRVPCIDKARNLIGFAPRIGLDAIVDDVVRDVARRQKP